MGKKLEGAIKGGLAAAPIALGYGAAGNPSGGLLAMGVGIVGGVAVTAGKNLSAPAPSRKGEFFDSYKKHGQVSFNEAADWYKDF